MFLRKAASAAMHTSAGLLGVGISLCTTSIVFPELLPIGAWLSVGGLTMMGVSLVTGGWAVIKTEINRVGEHFVFEDDEGINEVIQTQPNPKHRSSTNQMLSQMIPFGGFSHDHRAIQAEKERLEDEASELTNEKSVSFYQMGIKAIEAIFEDESERMTKQGRFM